MSANTPRVGIVMGSDSDLPTMEAAHHVLEELEVAHETQIVSAHRTPAELFAYGESAERRGLKVIVAGAGGAAHLPGMLASLTTLPVIGVPVRSSTLDGLDSLLSIAQMPRGVPVATVAVDGAMNAGLLAAQILATSDDQLASRLHEHRATMAKSVASANARLAHMRDEPSEELFPDFCALTHAYLVGAFAETGGSRQQRVIWKAALRHPGTLVKVAVDEIVIDAPISFSFWSRLRSRKNPMRTSGEVGVPSPEIEPESVDVNGWASVHSP